MKKILFILAFTFATFTHAQIIITGDAGSSSIVTDNQTITDLSLVGNVMSITMERGNTKTLDLTSIVGNVTIDDFSLVGTNLTLELSNGSTSTVSLAGIGGSTSITAGTNVTITGTGTSGDPYIINASASGGSANIGIKDEGNELTPTVSTINFTGAGVIASTVGDDVTVNIASGSGGSAYILVTSTSEITSAGENAQIEFRADINMSSNFTPPANQTWHFTTGSLNTLAFTLTGNNTRIFFHDPLKGIDAFSGTIAGTWIPPDNFTANNLGARSEGNEVFNGATATLASTTVTSSTANFTSNDVGKWISIVGAGRLQNIPLDTQVGTFQVGETITFSGGATATITNYVNTDPTGTIVATITSGTFPQELETFSGGTSGATARVRATITKHPHAHITTIANVVNSTTITLASPALNTAVNTTMVYGWNDRNAIENAAYIRNKKSGELEFLGNKTYFFNVIQANPAIQQVPYGFLIGNDTNGVIWNVNGRLQAFPHEIQDSKSFVIYRTDGSGIKGSGKIYGDYIYHKEENGRGEGNHGVYLSTLATNTRLTGSIDCSYWYGDAVYGSGDTQFMNQIDGANFVDGSTESPIQQGNILSDGTIDLADTEWWYSTNLMTLTGGNFNNITSRGLQRFVNLTGASFGGWEGMRTPYFKLAFYDVEGNFLFVTNEIVWYNKVPIPDKATQARVVFVTPLQPEIIQLNLRPDLNPDGLIMEGWTISYCGRQGISNGPSNATYRRIHGHHIGGLKAGPGYFMDYEDGERIKHNIIVEGSTFHDNWGDIILKGPDGFIIRDNTFMASSIATNNSTYANIETGISSLFGRNVKIYGNTLYNKSVTLDRQDHYFNNIQKGGILGYTANANRVTQNQFWNVYLTHYPDNARDRIGYPTVFIDNVFYYNMKKPGYWFKNNQNAATFIGNEFRWNAIADWNYSATDSDGFMVASSNGFDSFYLDQTQTIDFGGIHKDNTYSGMLPSSGTRDYASGNNRPVMSDSENEIYRMPVEYTYGLPVDYTFKNQKVFGWIEHDLLQYESSIISETPTISYLGGELKLLASDNYPWTNNGSNLFSTAARNVAFYFEDYTFTIEQAFTRTTGSQKLFSMMHLGTTTFNRCTFNMESMPDYVMDLTLGSNFGTGGGNFLIIDPVFKNGFSVVLGTGDHVVFTKANPLMETYAAFADEAAADLAGYPNGYLFLNSTTGSIELNRE